jgi:hypothetical protein
MARLVAILDLLVEHFDSEITSDQAPGVTA